MLWSPPPAGLAASLQPPAHTDGPETAAAPQQRLAFLIQQLSKVMGGGRWGGSRWKMGLRAEATQQLLISLGVAPGRDGSVLPGTPQPEQHAPGSRRMGGREGGC